MSAVHQSFGSRALHTQSMGASLASERSEYVAKGWRALPRSPAWSARVLTNKLKREPRDLCMNPLLHRDTGRCTYYRSHCSHVVFPRPGLVLPHALRPYRPAAAVVVAVSRRCACGVSFLAFSKHCRDRRRMASSPLRQRIFGDAAIMMSAQGLAFSTKHKGPNPIKKLDYQEILSYFLHFRIKKPLFIIVSPSKNTPFLLAETPQLQRVIMVMETRMMIHRPPPRLSVHAETGLSH